MLKHSPASHAWANDCFEQAMALDPKYAEPHASLGLNWFLSGMSGLRSARETMPLVRAEANEALSLDPSDPGPHFLLASVAAAYEYDWKKAAQHFSIAMAGASVSAEAHWAYASLYFQPWGRFEESVSHMEGAVERDPLNAFWRGVLASHLTHAGRHDQAVQQANEALELDESNIAPSVTLGRSVRGDRTLAGSGRGPRESIPATAAIRSEHWHAGRRAGPHRRARTGGTGDQGVGGHTASSLRQGLVSLGLRGNRSSG
jgi:tetratricopeptide (TPR) repeat protein